MKRMLRNLPIRHKLTIITMFTSGVALLLACLAFLTYEQIVFRAAMVGDLETTAEIIGENSAAALEFDDPASAEMTLRTLKAHAHVVGAAVYDKEGRMFAQYPNTGTPGGFSAPPVEPGGSRFSDQYLETFHEINLAGEPVGTVYVRSDLEEMRARLWRYALIGLVVMVASGLVAFMLSRMLQQVISRPISYLARVASQVATDRNYSVRATKQGEDELGGLIDAFNEMLTQIQNRDAALEQARHDLERRVEERTGELQAEVVERRCSEEALRESNHRFELVTHATNDVVWDWSIADDHLWWSENFHLLFGSPLARDGAAIESWTARIHPEDAPGVMKSVDEFIAGNGRIWSGEYRLRRGDGSYAFVFNRGYAVRNAQGRPLRMIGAIQDVTARKQAEHKLEAVNGQLLETSRRAGMSEVASSVLHNVGNVLNSVNVSAGLIADNVRKWRTSSLARVVTLLREQSQDLGAFISSDPRGQQLPAYLAQLSQHFQAGQQAIIGELDGLRMNIEHIKGIVAMQQSYARVSGVKEIVSVTELVEDSVRLNLAALNRHGVQVIREFDAGLAINVEKHKVLQILVNLIRNAKYACDESGRPDKRLTLRVSNGEGHIKIAVADNGVGIPPENLTLIFNHGFTTRKDGHGFGLHSGALAAQQLGGRLTAHSEGTGQGATFVLELPLETNASQPESQPPART